MSIDAFTLTVLEQMRAAVNEITDTHVRALARSYVLAWDDVADQLDQALTDLLTAHENSTVTRAQVARHARLSAALQTIDAELVRLAGEARVLMIGSLPSAVQIGGSGTVDAIVSQLPPGRAAGVIGWDMVDESAVRAIITRSTGQVTAAPLAAESQEAVRRHLVRSVVVGDNPRTTARRILSEVQGQFEGGIARAERISRTEMLDAHRAAAATARQANRATVTGWTWVSALTERTCPACWAMHGTVFPPNVVGPAGHPNCRCTAAPVTKSWASLGLDLDEPESLLPDAGSSFDALTPSQQRAVLGPARFEAWAAGDYPMSGWAVRRENPGWRPSYSVSRIAA